MLSLLTSPLLSQFSWLSHGFGWQNIPLEEMLPANIQTFPTKQIHSDKIIMFPTEGVVEADAFISNQAHVACAIRTADCVPLLMLDPQTRAVAAIHAGWRGTAQNIAVKTLQKMAEQYGSKIEDVVVAIGPSICGTCYEVGTEVIQAMQKLGYQSTSQTHLDIADVNKFTLLQAGVQSANIDLLSICTKCSGKPLASFRRDAGKARQVSFIFLK